MRFKGWLIDNMGSCNAPYLVRNDDGAIIRTDMEFYPSEQWIVQVVEEAKAFGRLSRYIPEGFYRGGWREQFAELAKMGSATFKNGKPRYFLGDIDHGTRRTQMCGIARVRGPFLYALDAMTKRYIVVEENS